MKLLIKNGKIYQERDTFTDALYIENGVITRKFDTSLR